MVVTMLMELSDVDGDVIFFDVNKDDVFVVVDVVFVVVDGDDVFLVVNAVYDLVVAPDGTSHVTATSLPLPPEKSKHNFLSSIETK